MLILLREIIQDENTNFYEKEVCISAIIPEKGIAENVAGLSLSLSLSTISRNCRPSFIVSS